MSLDQKFEEAKNLTSKLKKEQDNDTKLKLYALYKQSTIGKCKTSKPGMMDMVGRAKWNAWNDLKNMPKDNAKKSYIDLINKLYQEENPNETKFKEILTSIELECVYKIVLNRPTKMNALSQSMYNEIMTALGEAATSSSIKMCVITGSGDFFSSGNDLSNYLNQTESPEDALKNGCKMVETFIDMFINFPKPLIALVNGPAIGICFTVLGLFDLVYCSDKATFYAPFSRSALSPEGCSSYTFPKLMGHAKASEVLLFNKKLNAKEAFERNLVHEILPHNEMYALFNKKLEEFSKLNTGSLIESKKILRKFNRDELMRVNREEMSLLEKRLATGDFMESVMSFMNKKPKL